MTDKQWLQAPESIDSADADTETDAIEEANGIGGGDQSETRGLVRTFVTSLVLPITLVGILLIIGLWLVIGKFNLLGQ